MSGESSAERGPKAGPASDSGAIDPSLSSTLIRGIELLRCFGPADQALSNAELARRLGLNRPTVSRLCKTLIHLGYLRRDAKETFRLAPQLLALTYPVLSAMPWRHAVLHPMRELAQMCAGNSSLGVMSGDVFVHIQTAGNPPGWPHIPDIGQTGPLHRSALGWSLLSVLPEPERAAKIADLQSLHPEGFAASAEKTHAAIARCLKEGFCVSYGDWRPDLVAAAAPLGRTEDGLCVALACAVPQYRAEADYFETDLGPRLASAAASLRYSGVFTLAGGEASNGRR
ncbi:IclR family transcriptional regulator [Aquabacter spiritensis]|uniref:IclR family transcriptional regulator n=1 Tax=Aquabacter spiritensis TaxID=933073 RepID=A0A4R3LLW4_9HYPH|nr:IclR family transcriptional regulator [Aquabacter spiritensis]TCT00519.1 IclR family transcriptional regulator [Aquabacter spiritensis]